MRYRVLCGLSVAALLAASVVRGAEEPAAAGPVAKDAPSPELKSAAHRFADGLPASIDELKSMEELVREVSQQAVERTVMVRIGPTSGSGVLLQDGYVLCAAHVTMSPGRKVDMILSDGRRVKGKTLGIDQRSDAALIKITSEGEFPFAEMGDSSKIKKGQWCIATGHPGGYDPERPPPVRLGRVEMLQGDALVTDCTLISGDSGGPLFDLDGKVIGIHSRIGRGLHSNVHVPVNYYRRTWDRLAKGDVLGAPVRGALLGVVGDVDFAGGAKITSVLDESPAAKAGVQVDDVIVRFAGKDIKSFEDLAVAVRKKKPGDEIELEILRGEERMKLKLKLGRR